MVSFIQDEVKKIENDNDCTMYITTGINDAYLYVKKVCETNQGKLRFYACGGDGTLNEVINGSIDYPNTSVTCVPIGSGNDFIKNFSSEDAFMNIQKLIHGEEILVDALKVNGRYTINICNFGFDAFVAENMIKFKNKAFIRGKMAYNIAVLYSLLFRMKHPCKITVDGELVYDGKILLTAFANGICYGGGYYCAPKADVKDGLIDVCIVKTLSRPRFIGMIKLYKEGKHLDSKKVAPYIIYRQAKAIDIAMPNEVIYCMDGEIERAKNISITMEPKSVRFIVPR